MKLQALALLLAAMPLMAEQPEIMKKLSAHWKTSKEFTLAVANQMPEADYGFKPNPAQMSFGEQMVHIAGGNLFFFSKISGKKPDLPNKPADMKKETILKYLADSFDFAGKAMDALTVEQLHETVDLGEDGKMTGVEAVMFGFDHVTHHRGQTVVYLRVKNIKPVDYRF